MTNGKRNMLRAAAGCAVLAICLQSAAYAGENNVHSYHGKEVTADDIVSRFLGQAAGTPEDSGMAQFRTRGIRIHGQENEQLESRVIARNRVNVSATVTAAPAPAAGGKSAAPQEKAGDCPNAAASVALPIRFALNSAILEAEAYTNLRQMGQAMKSSALGSCKFVVEGHTDASGSAGLNARLSESRAYAVREYLVSMEIEPARLLSVGKGESQPLNDSDPRAPENRRVQFRIAQN
jgi:outer membrane protein OmpA-like peptidoglycan-associated protein